MHKVIIVTARKDDWEQAQVTGKYTKSTINSKLAEVGFIHCTFPDQVMDMVNRKFSGEDGLVLLFVNPAKVEPEIRYEAALSGRVGTFPHIYGQLNTDAVFAVAALQKDRAGKFIAPTQLDQAYE